ncbi:MAG: phosphoribosylamine--glycine ligase, partial [Chloroflexi bacterium]|nr:phosphoribosylamine--glycine ligase [Chloroflexota bacterium]
MRILVIGSGGREHALVWKLARSSRVEQLFAVPGNAGTARIAENIAVAATDIDGLVKAATTTKCDLVVVGPEVALAMGVVDSLREAG